MPLRKTLLAVSVSLSLFTARAQEIHLPMITHDNITLSVSVNAAGTPVYSVAYKSKTIISSSELGFRLADDTNFHSGFAIVNSGTSSFDQT